MIRWVSIALYVVLLSGCATALDSVNTAVKKTTELFNKGEGGNAGGDIEDRACAKIAYDKRTVCRIQVHLNDLGYKVGTEDGLYGPNTRRGILSFQNKEKFDNRDGTPSLPLLNSLRQKNTRYRNPLITAAIAAGGCGLAAKALESDHSAIWAVTCGAAAAGLQRLSNQGKQSYAMRYYEIKDENDHVENEIIVAKEKTAQNQRIAKAKEKATEELIVQAIDDRTFVQEAEALRKEINTNIAQTKRDKEDQEIRLAILESQISDVDELIAEQPSEQEYKTALSGLNERKASLVAAINSSKSAETILLAQKRVLDTEIVKRA